MNTGDKIRKLRIDKGNSQDYLAGQLGIKQTTYSKIEKGETKLTMDRLVRIANLLEVNPTGLFNETHGNTNDIKKVQTEYIHTSSPAEHPYFEIVNHLEGEINDLRKERDKLLHLIEKIMK